MSKKEQVLALADKIQAESLIVIDDKAGIGMLKEGAIDALLPEGLDKATLDKAVETEQTIGSALAVAFGRQSKVAFDSNKELENAILKTPISTSTTLSVDVKRAHTFTHKLKKDEQGNPIETTVTRNGYVTVGYDTRSPMSDKTIRETVQKAWDGLSD